MQQLNGYGKQLSYTQNLVIELNSELHKVINFDSIATSYINDLSRLLTLGEAGSKFYDIALNIYDDKVTPQSVRKEIVSFTNEVKIYDFVLMMRKALSGTPLETSESLALLSFAYTMVMKAYNLGTVISVLTESKEVITINCYDAVDIRTLLEVLVNEMPHLRKGMPSSTISDGDRKKIRRELRGKIDFQLEQVIKDGGYLDENRKEDFVNLMSDTSLIAARNIANNIFNETDFNFGKLVNYANLLDWEVDPIQNKANTETLVTGLIVEQLLPFSALKERAFYIREKGVRIVFEESPFGFDTIEVREWHNTQSGEEEHLLNIYYKLAPMEGERFFSVNMKDLSTFRNTQMYVDDCLVLMFVLRWLGVLNEATEFSDVQINTAIEKFGYFKDGEQAIRLVKESMDELNKGYIQCKYYYETPAQWNYNISNSGKLTQKSDTTEYHRIVKVGRYTRRLPARQKPSDTAKSLAAKYYIELRDGYTLVDEFERLQKS